MFQITCCNRLLLVQWLYKFICIQTWQIVTVKHTRIQSTLKIAFGVTNIICIIVNCLEYHKRTKHSSLLQRINNIVVSSIILLLFNMIINPTFFSFFFQFFGLSFHNVIIVNNVSNNNNININDIFFMFLPNCKFIASFNKQSLSMYNNTNEIHDKNTNSSTLITFVLCPFLYPFVLLLVLIKHLIWNGCTQNSLWCKYNSCDSF